MSLNKYRWPQRNNRKNSYFSSINIEVIRTFYYYFFYQDILHKKNTQALFKHLNTLKKHNKAHKQLSFKYKAINFYSNMRLKNIVDTRCNE